MSEQKSHEYYRFTGLQRLDKAIHTLEGLLVGITADEIVNDVEMKQLATWVAINIEFANKHPFNELIPIINKTMLNGKIDDEERADLLWLCNRFTTENDFFDHITSDLQRLQGIMAGIIADKKIVESELHTLATWLDEHRHLTDCWPYDEIDALVTAVMADGKIDDQEHKLLLSYFGDFENRYGNRVLQKQVSNENITVTGVVAMDPQLEFSNRKYCFTGASDRATREDFRMQIESLGGEFKSGVSKSLDYLIIGGEGNPCWAYCCYGRKVENAVTLRKQGHPILLVHEFDFWDAVADADADSQ